MTKWFGLGFWQTVARIVLRNRTAMLVAIGAITVLLALQWKNIEFTYTEANLLPQDHPVNIEYKAFLDKFGEEGNLIIMGVKDSTLFTPKAYAAYGRMMRNLKTNKEVSLIIAVNDLKKLQKNDSLQTFETVPFVEINKVEDAKYLLQIRAELFTDLPFYEGLLFNKKSGSVRSAIYLDKEIVNTLARKDFVVEKLIPEVEKFEKATGIDLRVSGMPYIRTMNAETIKGEIGIFILAALGITSLMFFFFFRSFKATMLTIGIVIVGVMWSFGILGLLNYPITVLTALLPTLVIVIGVPNCIFLTNKYHQEYKIHSNKVKAIQRVITKIGMATVMTNLTTAIGFATFATSNNRLLIEFGVVTSLMIMLLCALCIVALPVFFSYMSPPKERHLQHLDQNYVQNFLEWIHRCIKNHRFAVYASSIGILIIGIIGIYEMRVSGSIIEDMPKGAPFFEDIVFFEKEFDGVMPLEIVIDTKRKKGVMKLSTLKKMDQLEETINHIPELSKPISIVNLIKYSKQAYYNGNPEYYDLPTSQEQNFILSYAKNAAKDSKENVMKSYVDSTGQYARITTFMKDENGSRMPIIEAEVLARAKQLFPEDRYNVSVTGKALVFQKGTSYLLNNLVVSLLFALFLTSLLVAFMFRSFKMVLVSLIPNLLPLLMTAGLMGFLDIPLKPSTILVFGIAFGLSVDDTIRYLAQYREELRKNNWRIKQSVFSAFKEASLSMFYTSIVLFFGFLVFLLSDFGGTKALGGLVALTLIFGLLANLMLLPSLVLTLNKTLANEQEFVTPYIDVLGDSDEEIEDLESEEDN